MKFQPGWLAKRPRLYLHKREGDSALCFGCRGTEEAAVVV